jgi:predicted phosphate transport protein (TIGR00153 family)
MANKQTNYYFSAFVGLVKFATEEAEYLQRVTAQYDLSKLDVETKKMHQIEHAADIEKHKVIEKLVKEFITPIEREDIISITQKIDDVTDFIEDVMLKLYMFNVQELRDEFKDFTKVILDCTKGLETVAREFYNFKRSTTIKDAIIEVNRLEEVCDKIYIDAVHRLFAESKDPVHLMIWEDIFLSLEKCCDACEEVADTIESVIMKNS